MGMKMKEAPLISVITPYHNIDHALFVKTADSIAAQTLDKNLIEWIIIVHNSASGESEFVRSVVDKLGCARVYDLDNDVHSASSPRNYAFSFVTAKYITFLDGDDTLTPECLLTITEGMEAAGADIGKYRSEISEDDGEIVSFLDNRVRFPQTKPLLLIRKGDEDIKKLLTMAGMMMSCQVIRRDFLEKNELRFREDIRIEEDVLFNLQSIHHAETIAVFPQLIGYIYYMHHGSTMQNEHISSTDLLNVCTDLSKQLEFGLGAGLYMSYLFLGHMKLVSDMIEKSDADETVRRKIRDIFLPFFKRINMPEPDGKIFSPETLDGIRFHQEDIILFLDDPTITDGVLRKILRENGSTELGQEWGFDKIFNHEDYELNVPVTGYDNYAPYIELTTRIGESGIFLHDDIKGYAITSGCTGVPKRVPYSARQLEYLCRILNEIEECPGSTYLMMQSIRLDEKNADDTWIDSISGAVLHYIRNRIHFSSYTLTDRRASVTSPEELVFVYKPFNASYRRLLYALLDDDVRMIFAPFSWQVFNALRKLEDHTDRIIKDLSEKFASEDPKYKDRIDKLKSILTEGFDTPIVNKIWPKLTKIIAGNSGSFRIYGDNLKRYIGDIPVEGYYVSSEGMHGIYSADIGGYRLLNNENYYEFLRSGEGKAVPVQDVVPGETYELIVTNRSGFYRYALGDIVELKSVDNAIPVVDLLYRRSDILQLPDDYGFITPDVIYSLVKKLSQRSGHTIFDYCYAISEDDDHFELYLETEKDESISATADEILTEMSAAYKAARDDNKLSSAVCLFLEPETQEAYGEYVAYRQHSGIDQLKPVRYLDNPVKRRFFNTMLI
jgi:glycosyltransferase involved in cell wall biosynthesis